MDPCPFVRLVVESLTLKLLSSPTKPLTLSNVHPSTTPCFCKIHIHSFPSHTALLPLSSTSSPLLIQQPPPPLSTLTMLLSIVSPANSSLSPSLFTTAQLAATVASAMPSYSVVSFFPFNYLPHSLPPILSTMAGSNWTMKWMINLHICYTLWSGLNRIRDLCFTLVANRNVVLLFSRFRRISNNRFLAASSVSIAITNPIPSKSFFHFNLLKQV